VPGRGFLLCGFHRGASNVDGGIDSAADSDVVPQSGVDIAVHDGVICPPNLWTEMLRDVWSSLATAEDLIRSFFADRMMRRG
jgi:hypothetical protein